MSSNDLTDEELPEYAIIHCQTPVAAFHKIHVERLLRMAGDMEEADAVNKSIQEWFYLGEGVIYPIVKKIRQRQAQKREDQARNDLPARLQKEMEIRDAMAKLISNTGHPRSDNNEGRCAALLEDAKEEIVALREVLDDHQKLVRELDVALNGEDGAAKQASLCDIVSQVKDHRWVLVKR